jgi:transketolase
MPCWELFEEQSIEYKYSLFPDGVPVLAVEAGSVVGWKQYAHSVIGMTTFGASAPAKDVFKYFGFTVENIIQKAKETISFYSKQPPESPIKRPF